MRVKKTYGILLCFVLGIIYILMFYNPKSDKEKNGNEILNTKKKYLAAGLEETNKEKESSKIVIIDSEGKRTAIDSLQQHKQSGVKTKYIIPVLLMACNRASAVKRSIDQILEIRPSENQFPVIVSQDCSDRQTTKVIASYGKKIKFIKQPDLSRIQSRECSHPIGQGYCKISRHYKWALTQVFDVLRYNSCIILEDDLDIAPDFFEYFSATRHLLDSDPSIFCISAWNDNGKKGLVKGNGILYRTDFFPGLGWMMKKSLWDVLKPKWPVVYWDDWLRRPEQRRGRVCIRPEISRTRTFGEVGVSKGQFYEEYLKYIQLNEIPYPFSEHDLSYLEKNKYDEYFLTKVKALPLVTLDNLSSSGPEVRLRYSSEREFVNLASQFGIMKDFKSGIPRTGYKGIVSFIHNGVRVYLVPIK